MWQSWKSGVYNWGSGPGLYGLVVRPTAAPSQSAPLQAPHPHNAPGGPATKQSSSHVFGVRLHGFGCARQRRRGRGIWSGAADAAPPFGRRGVLSGSVYRAQRRAWQSLLFIFLFEALKPRPPNPLRSHPSKPSPLHSPLRSLKPSKLRLRPSKSKPLKPSSLLFEAFLPSAPLSLPFDSSPSTASKASKKS